MENAIIERGSFTLSRTSVQVVEELRYCLYARKSSESDEKQALSIDSQIREMTQLAEVEKLDIIEIKRESHVVVIQPSKFFFEPDYHIGFNSSVYKMMF